jgi:DNA-binding response OmpR family regulator
MNEIDVAGIEIALANYEALPPAVFKGLTLDRQTGLLTHAGQEVRGLTGMEAKMLAALMLAPSGFLDRLAAFDALYWDRGETGEPEPKIIDVWICRLRKAIKPLGFRIATIWGRGYQLEAIEP